MILTRNIDSETILNKVDLDLLTEGPEDVQNKLYNYAGYLNDIAGGTTPIVVPVDYLNAFESMPDYYTVECCTPRMAVFVKGKKNTTTKFVWYDDLNGTTELEWNIDKDSIVFLQVQGRKLFYDSHLITLVKSRPQCTFTKVYFLDWFGLPQSIVLQKRRSQYSYEALSSYRYYNGQQDWQIHKRPTFTVNVGEGGYNTTLRQFLHGFVSSEAYVAGNMDGQLMPVTIINISTVTSSFDRSIDLTGTLQVSSKFEQLLGE